MFLPRDNRGQNNEQSECLLRPQLFYTHGPGLTGSIVSNNHYHQGENNWTNELAYETTFYVVV